MRKIIKRFEIVSKIKKMWLKDKKVYLLLGNSFSTILQKQFSRINTIMIYTENGKCLKRNVPKKESIKKPIVPPSLVLAYFIKNELKMSLTAVSMYFI